MSQTELATRAATSQPTISAYESGTKQPSLTTLERIAEAAGVGLDIVLVDRTMLSAAVTEARAELDDKASAFRILADVSVRLENADIDVFRQAIRTDPGRIGPGWDALVGGIVERLAHGRNVAVPAWTHDHHRFNDVFWFVNDYPSLRAITLLETPAELATRGVFCDEASLTGL